MKNASLKQLVLVALAILTVSTAQAARECRDLFATHKNPSISQLQYLELSSSRHFQQISNRVADFDQFNLREYPTVNVTNRLRQLGAGFEALVVDPGLLQHLDSFSVFMNSQDRTLSPWMARDLFARSPEMQTKVYRGLALTEAELSSVLKLGMRSNLGRHVGSVDVYERMSSGRQSDLENRQNAKFGDSYFLSVSSYPEIAIAVAQTFERKKVDSKRILFEISISKIDVITNDRENGLWTEVPNQVNEFAFTTRGVETIVPFDRKVESFVLWSIPATSLRVVTDGPIGASFRFVHH